MVIHARFAALAALLALAAVAIGCRSTTAPAAIDPAMASCVPAGTLVLGGLNLDQLRANPLYQKLPLNESLRNAGYLLLASDGKNILSIARGNFRETPAGGALIAPNLAIAGPPDLIRAAAAQHKKGTTGAAFLLFHAEALAGRNQIWIVAQGGVNLPLTGDAANLNRLLRGAEYVTAAVRLDSRFELDVAGVCRTGDAGRQFEESLRAIVSLAAAANARQAGVAAVLHSIQVRREDRIVHARLSAKPEAADNLLHLAPR